MGNAAAQCRSWKAADSARTLPAPLHQPDLRLTGSVAKVKNTGVFETMSDIIAGTAMGSGPIISRLSKLLLSTIGDAISMDTLTIRSRFGPTRCWRESRRRS